MNVNLDNNAYKVLSKIKDELKEAGISPTMSEAVRELERRAGKRKQ